VVTGEELSRINYGTTNTQRKARTMKRCRECGGFVRWCEKPNGWHVKLDWHPSSTGRWRITQHGIAECVPPAYAGGHGMYDRHVCPDVKP
jgi:hypothetical protein